MADLTRERLEQLRHQARSRVQFSWEEILTLLDMASRCVSEETVKKLAIYLGFCEHDDDMRISDQTGEDLLDEFDEAVRSDLQPAAESLARKAEGK